MKELFLVEKIANRVKELAHISGDTANNWTYRESLSIILDLRVMAKALCIKIDHEFDIYYEEMPERRCDGETEDFRDGKLPEKFKLLTDLWDYSGFLISSFDNKCPDLKEYRDKVRILRILKWYADRNYSGKKQRLLKALQKDEELFGVYNGYLIDVLTKYSFNQLRKEKEHLTRNLLNSLTTPSDLMLSKISKFQ